MKKEQLKASDDNTQSKHAPHLASYLCCVYCLEISRKQPSTTSSSALDKIPLHSKQLSKEEWQFASFSKNTLTGAYGNLSLSNKSKNDNDHNSTSKKSTNNTKLESMYSRTSFNNSTANVAATVYSNGNNQAFASNQSLETPTKASNREIFIKAQQFLHIFNQEKDQKRFVDFSRYLLLNTEKETSTKVWYIPHMCCSCETRLWYDSALFAVPSKIVISLQLEYIQYIVSCVLV